MTDDKSFLILGIDTSGEYCSVGLADGERVLGEISERAPQEHSSKIIPFIHKVLKDNGLKVRDINAIAVSIGPGCFTGLRVGVAAAKALAQILNIPIVGVPTLDIIALNAVQGQSLICVAVDARKQQIYASLYSLMLKSKGPELRKLTKDMVLTVEELLAVLESRQGRPNGQDSIVFIGNAIRIYGDTIKEKMGGEERSVFMPEELWYPRAVNVALEGFKKLRKNKKGEDLYRLKPVYLREPDIRKK